MEWIKTMAWINVADRKPPENRRVLAYGERGGFMVVEYYFHPAWEPFDEERYVGVSNDRTNRMRRLNEMRRDEKESEGWGCACEDSYWPIAEFTQWCELPDRL